MAWQCLQAGFLVVVMMLTAKAQIGKIVDVDAKCNIAKLINAAL